MGLRLGVPALAGGLMMAIGGVALADAPPAPAASPPPSAPIFYCPAPASRLVDAGRSLPPIGSGAGGRP